MKKLLFSSIGIIVMFILLNSERGDAIFIEILNFEKKSQASISNVDIQESNSNSVDFDYLPTSTTNLFIQHTYFTLSYNEIAEQAEWVAYELKKEFLKNSAYKRPYFIADPKVKTGSADWRNYRKSGYDKGHLCPAADMEFNINAYNDTFFTSNISPQLHEFNGGIWNRLEQKVRFWALKYDGVYVVTGGVFKNSKKTIGNEKVVVPEYFYKIILDEYKGTYKMIAFLVPNKKRSMPLFDYVVSVDSLEEMTGIDFFPKLNDRIENDLEKKTDYRSWFLK